MNIYFCPKNSIVRWYSLFCDIYKWKTLLLQGKVQDELVRIQPEFKETLLTSVQRFIGEVDNYEDGYLNVSLSCQWTSDIIHSEYFDGPVFQKSVNEVPFQ